MLLFLFFVARRFESTAWSDGVTYRQRGYKRIFRPMKSVNNDYNIRRACAPIL